MPAARPGEVAPLRQVSEQECSGHVAQLAAGL